MTDDTKHQALPKLRAQLYKEQHMTETTSIENKQITKKSNFYFVFTINNILLSHFEPSLWNLATQVFPFKK